jgi:hypothetical protein
MTVIYMKSTPFDDHQDYAPIPFDQEICQLALQLKKKGLKWHPHVGCFVWDPEEYIPVPSPFPQRIYFILNLNHFLKIFKSIDKMIEYLVWLPTWHQARLICHELGLSRELIFKESEDSGTITVEEETIFLYKLLLKNLKKDQD